MDLFDDNAVSKIAYKIFRYLCVNIATCILFKLYSPENVVDIPHVHISDETSVASTCVGGTMELCDCFAATDDEMSDVWSISVVSSERVNKISLHAELYIVSATRDLSLSMFVSPYHKDMSLLHQREFWLMHL